MIDSLTLDWTTVPTAVGDLRGLVHVPATLPEGDRLPGIVLVDGSGDGACDDWGGWPEWIASCGAVVLTHDKPGSGGSPGHWTQQTMADRAEETRAAVEVLRAHPRCAGQPVGLLGISQGGWVSLLASSLGGVDFVVSVSGPGVSPAVQERDRIARELADLAPEEHTAAMAWVDERRERLLAGDSVTAVLADQQQRADRPWFDAISLAYDTAENLTFIAGMLDFDPVPVMRAVTSPVLALFGGADTIVPVAESVVAYAENLATVDGAEHGLAVFPGANHGLFVADPDPDVPRRDQLAAGFLPMLTGFLTTAQVRVPAAA